MGHSPPSCLHNRKMTAAVSQGWRAMAVGAAAWACAGAAASCGLAPALHGRSWGVTPATARRLMARANLSSREKMPFSFLSVLFLTWLQWNWTAQHPEGRGSQFLHCDATARPRVLHEGPVKPVCANGLGWAHRLCMVEMARCASSLNYNHITDHALLTEIKSSLSL